MDEDDGTRIHVDVLNTPTEVTQLLPAHDIQDQPEITGDDHQSHNFILITTAGLSLGWFVIITSRNSLEQDS